jgi:succinate dehydrogenase flavin-adding protein (antitoxin of CptAB toxin-antitoxin module)
MPVLSKNVPQRSNKQLEFITLSDPQKDKFIDILNNSDNQIEKAL